MKWRLGSDIHSRTQLISLGSGLLLTLVLAGFFTFVRLQDLRQEVNHTGQLIADQLAQASEYGLRTHNLSALDSLLQATLHTPHVRFLEIRNQDGQILRYVERTGAEHPVAADTEVFRSAIGVAAEGAQLATGMRAGAQVTVGMSSDAFSSRQQEILFKAALLALAALALTYFQARSLARSLSRPIRAMIEALDVLRAGHYQTRLPHTGSGELAEMAAHINSLASGLEQAQQEQQQAIAQLISAREEAEQASRAKSDFLAMMSHELRTPMNGVLGMLQLLETTSMTREQEEYTALASESTEHLLKVINDILDFSRIERDALELERIPFNLVELLQSSAQAFQHSAQQRGLELLLDIPPGLEDLECRGDPTRIRQILVNLLGNALKFTEEGSIRLEARWQALDSEILWLSCAVRDTGIGIAPQRLEHMFDAFQQADTSISRRYGGTGLGLAIARTLAQRMGGTLQAESHEGHGSLFTLEIPLPFRAQEPRPQRSPLPESGSGGGVEVLLVEDNPVNQTVIEAMLRSLGYRVSLVPDGMQAVQRAAEGGFAAILMDCRLPLLDGYQATRQIRRLPGCGSLPIIALTANALQGDREVCLQAGMNDYLAKPFKRADLQHVLQRWLGEQHTNAGREC